MPSHVSWCNLYFNIDSVYKTNYIGTKVINSENFWRNNTADSTNLVIYYVISWGLAPFYDSQLER